MRSSQSFIHSIQEMEKTQKKMWEITCVQTYQAVIKILEFGLV